MGGNVVYTPGEVINLFQDNDSDPSCVAIATLPGGYAIMSKDYSIDFKPINQSHV